MIIGLAGCDTPIEPTVTDGEIVPGTRGARCEGDAPFSISPNGRWLGYASTHTHADNATQPGIVLVDLKTGTNFEPEPDTQALTRIRSGHGPSIRTLCWSANSDTAYLSGPSLPAASGSVPLMLPTKGHTRNPRQNVGMQTRRKRIPNWFAITLDPSGALKTVSEPDCIRNDVPAWRFGSPLSDEPEITRGLRIDTSASERVRLIMPDGRVLAEHNTQKTLSDRIGVTTYTWSPEGRYLAYVITEGFGMGGAPTRGYLVKRTTEPDSSQPRQLASFVYALGWYGDDDLYACMKVNGGATTTIAHWKLPL